MLATMGHPPLLGALESGKLAGAGLDVMFGECPEDRVRLCGNKLLQYAKIHKNLLITPHIGGAAPNAMLRTEVLIARKFDASLTAFNSTA